MRKLSWVAAVLVTVVVPGASRGQGLDRSRRPVADAPPAFRFPVVVNESLPNGLRVRIVEDHSVPVVAVRAVLGADSTYDPPGKEGLFGVAVGAMREGTAALNGERLAAATAALGNTITPTSFTTTTSSFGGALALMAQMLTAPSLDSSAVERRKVLQAAAARRVAQTPSIAPRHVFYSLLYGDGDAYARSLAPTEASVASITAADVRRFYEQLVSPSTTTIIVTGDVTPARALDEVRRAFGKWESKAAARDVNQLSSVPARSTAIHLLDVPSPQAYLYVGSLGPRRSPADAAAAELLGAVATSRMQQVLRDKRAFMYSGTIGLTWRRPTQPSAFLGSALVDARKVDSALVEWLTLLGAIRESQPPTQAELEAARRARIGSLPARFDGADSVASRLLELARDGLSPEYFNDWVSRLSSMPAADVAAAAQRVIDPAHLIIVIAGDRRIIEPALRGANLAPIVVVDADGRPKP